MIVEFADNLAAMTSGNVMHFDVLDKGCTRLILRSERGGGLDLLVYAPDPISCLCAAWGLFQVQAQGTWKVDHVEKDLAGIPTRWEENQVAPSRIAVFEEGVEVRLGRMDVA